MHFSPVTSSQPNMVAAPAEEQKNESMRFLALNLRIFKQMNSNPHSAEFDSSITCYRHLGMGNLVQISNKVYILTVGHLFTEQNEEYLLVNNTPMFPFRYALANTAPNPTVDATVIHIGDIDPQTQAITLKTNSSFQGRVHLYP